MLPRSIVAKDSANLAVNIVGTRLAVNFPLPPTDGTKRIHTFQQLSITATHREHPLLWPYISEWMLEAPRCQCLYVSCPFLVVHLPCPLSKTDRSPHCRVESFGYILWWDQGTWSLKRRHSSITSSLRKRLYSSWISCFCVTFCWGR